MRHLRWKRKYLSGFSFFDLAKQVFYQELRQLDTKMEHREHCQDMEDLMDDLKQQAHNLFETKATNDIQARIMLSEQSANIAQTLEQHLPLTALDTPACRDCALCEESKESVQDWLLHTASSPEEKDKDVAA